MRFRPGSLEPARCKPSNEQYASNSLADPILVQFRLCSDWDGVKPDIITLGKALSGGIYPVSAVLANKEVMLCIKPGEHGSTYGGNPLGCAVAMTALDVLVDEGLVDRAQRLGEVFRSKVREIGSPLIKEVRGRGLLNAVVIDETKSKKGRSAWQLCLLMKSKG
jgi:ornithine--oxo-acid transaminase